MPMLSRNPAAPVGLNATVTLLKMAYMKRMIALVAVFVLVFAFAAPVFASDQASNLKVTVLRDENGKPVRNASVILHPVGKDGKQSHGGKQLKTNADGIASLDGIPYGKLRVQVIASGMQTFGDDYEINQDQQEIVIKLKKPQEQYSIYK
jgi:Carboxypeptidase regulatory-like domain